MRQVYLAATGQNRGKTTASLGLFDLFLARGLKAAFMKPVERHWLVAEIIPGSTKHEEPLLAELTASAAYLRRFVPEGGLAI